MQHTIKYHYPITYVPHGYHNPWRAFGDASVDIEVREVVGADAPIALRVGNPPDRHNDKDRFSTKPDGHKREVRLLGDRLFVESISQADLAELIADPFKINDGPFGELIQFTQKQDPNRREYAQIKALAETTTIRAIRETQGKWKNGKYVALRDEKTKDDQGDGMRAQIIKRASELVLVDGILFIECQEPILKMGEYTNRLMIVEREITTGPGKPYAARTYRDTYSSSLKDAKPFISFLKSNKLVDGRYPLPEFDVLDASVCHYDGATNDVLMLSGKLMSNLDSNLRALPRQVIDASFTLEDVIKCQPERLNTISPALEAALGELAMVKASRPDAQMNAMNQYQLHRSDLSDEHWSHNQVSTRTDRNFHLAAAALNSGKTISELSSIAALALARWQAAAGFDRLPGETTSAMVRKFEDVIAREVNTFWQLRMLAKRSNTNYSDLVERALSGERLIELKTLENDVTTEIVSLHAGRAQLISDNGIVSSEKASQTALDFIAMDQRDQQQMDLAAMSLGRMTR